MKIALVHDWINGLRGGERCLDTFLQCYPDADVFTLIHEPGTSTSRIDSRVRVQSVLGASSWVRERYRYFLPLYPLVVRQFDLSGYDVVISLSHAAAKNVSVPRGSLHLCYCFTPMRYVWDQRRAYFGTHTTVLEPMLFALRIWDRWGASGVHAFAAISHFVAARIRCFYHRSSTVIYPPVDTSWIAPAPAGAGDAFLYAGALVPYKNVDRIIEAFNHLRLPLRIVGSGPEEAKLRALAGPHITFLGALSDEALAGHYAQCRALVFAAIEDFGMIPIECMAAGRPVIAPAIGGTKETIRGRYHWQNEREFLDDHATGVFIRPTRHNGRGLTVESIVDSVRYFLAVEKTFNPEDCIARAREFSPEAFRARWDRFFHSCTDVKAKASAL